MTCECLNTEVWLPVQCHFQIRRVEKVVRPRRVLAWEPWWVWRKCSDVHFSQGLWSVHQRSDGLRAGSCPGVPPGPWAELMVTVGHQGPKRCPVSISVPIMGHIGVLPLNTQLPPYLQFGGFFIQLFPKSLLLPHFCPFFMKHQDLNTPF